MMHKCKFLESSCIRRMAMYHDNEKKFASFMVLEIVFVEVEVKTLQ